MRSKWRILFDAIWFPLGVFQGVVSLLGVVAFVAAKWATVARSIAAELLTPVQWVLIGTALLGMAVVSGLVREVARLEKDKPRLSCEEWMAPHAPGPNTNDLEYTNVLQFALRASRSAVENCRVSLTEFYGKAGGNSLQVSGLPMFPILIWPTSEEARAHINNGDLVWVPVARRGLHRKSNPIINLSRESGLYISLPNLGAEYFAVWRVTGIGCEPLTIRRRFWFPAEGGIESESF